MGNAATSAGQTAAQTGQQGVGGIVGGIGSALGVLGLKEGAIVSKPTVAMLGEGKEPEAVVPISKIEALLKRISQDKGAICKATQGKAVTPIDTVIEGKK
jgi:hypothetical protein